MHHCTPFLPCRHQTSNHLAPLSPPKPTTLGQQRIFAHLLSTSASSSTRACPTALTAPPAKRQHAAQLPSVALRCHLGLPTGGAPLRSPAPARAPRCLALAVPLPVPSGTTVPDDLGFHARIIAPRRKSPPLECCFFVHNSWCVAGTVQEPHTRLPWVPDDALSWVLLKALPKPLPAFFS